MSHTVDLCFLMDCTGSMGSYIAACKNDITQTVDTIVAEYPDAVIKLGFVAYRDHTDGAQRIEKFPFNANVSAFGTFVGSLQATGGGDYPEDVLGGLWEAANNMGWTSPTRVLFHIFDAPPHGCPKFHDSGGDRYPNGHPNDQSTSTIFGTLRQNLVHFYMMKLSNALEKMVSVFIQDAASAGYVDVKECPGVGDVSLVMKEVGKAVVRSMSVRVSTKVRPERRIAQLLPRPVASSYKVYCGIDFGTYGSAFAFCTSGDPVPRAVNSWSGRGVNFKTLTNLLLAPNKKCVPGPHGFGDAAQEYYLGLDPQSQKAHYFFRRFKMALYENAVASEERKEETDIQGYIVAANGKRIRSSVVLVEALKFMVNHVMNEITKTHADVTDISQVQWIITVPAIWSQKSRRVMAKAAYKAGIPRANHDQLIVALEPECASVIARDSLELKENDCYMLVDCGGGTVDMACHRLISGGQEVTEIYKASGGAWGATYIDDEFIVLLGMVFGDDVMAAIAAEVDGMMPGLMEHIVKNFNLDKMGANLQDESRKVDLMILKPILERVCGSVANVNARLATANYRGIVGGMKFSETGKLSLSREIWSRMFDVVIEPMIDAMTVLLNQPGEVQEIDTLCLVGGFSESRILYDRIVSSFPTKRVVRPPNPMMTVVKGAAKFGIQPAMIAARTAPKTIGIAVQDKFNPATDPVERKSEFDRDDGYTVEGVFFPFVNAGQSIPRDMEPVVHYFEPVNPKKFQIEIYQSDEEHPRFVPDRPCGTIGPIDIPPDFDLNAYDICVQIDFSGRMVSVRVQFGENHVCPVEIDWE